MEAVLGVLEIPGSMTVADTLTCNQGLAQVGSCLLPILCLVLSLLGPQQKGT